jgi:hypothetical protein
MTSLPLQAQSRELPQHGLFRRFWQGGCSLPFAYWVMGWLVNAALAVLLGGVILYTRRQAYNPYLVLATLSAYWGLTAAAQLYLTVGIWRSARRYRDARAAERKTGLWGLAAQAAVGLGVLGFALALFTTGAAELAEGFNIAFRGDPAVGPYSIRLMRDGGEAEITGGFKYGLARDAERLFATEPRLGVLHLNSGGGRLGEAVELASLIRARGLATYVSASCSSACTIAFLAGRERYLKAGAKLGFHRASFAGHETAEEMRRLLASSGIEGSFVERAVAEPQNSIWYPSDTELAAANVVLAVVGPYRFAASGLGIRPTLEDFKGSLRKATLFAAIEVAAPRAFDNAAELYQRHYFEGWSEGRIADEIRVARFSPLLRDRLMTAPDELLVAYARLLADQYEALGARDGGLCFELATRGGDTRTVMMMPASLQQRELDLSIEVLRATERRRPAPPSLVTAASVAISQKLIDKYGVDRVKLLMAPAQVTSDQYGLFCQLSVAMFRAIAELPQDQAGAAMGNIFTAMVKAAGK